MTREYEIELRKIALQHAVHLHNCSPEHKIAPPLNKIVPLANDFYEYLIKGELPVKN